jgi:hypothetical protein
MKCVMSRTSATTQVYNGHRQRNKAANEAEADDEATSGRTLCRWGRT